LTLAESPLAQRGHSSTALTACFAGPLFNMLISMAAGFGAYFAKEGVTRWVGVSPPWGCQAVYMCVCVCICGE